MQFYRHGLIAQQHDNASPISPVKIPSRYNKGSAADTRGDLHPWRSTIAELNFTPAPDRSRNLGTLTAAPAAISTSSSGRYVFWPEMIAVPRRTFPSAFRCAPVLDSGN